MKRRLAAGLITRFVFDGFARASFSSYGRPVIIVVIVKLNCCRLKHFVLPAAFFLFAKQNPTLTLDAPRWGSPAS
jgi:hypothetical protein